MTSQRLIIDCDVGLDDAQALMMALSRPPAEDVRVEAILAVRGNTNVDQVTENIRKVLLLCGRPDIPVYRGCDEPFIVDDREDFTAYHGVDGLGDVQDDDNAIKSDGKIEKQHAVTYLLDKVNQHPGVYTLICLGPLTNIATALKIDKDLGAKLKECHIMGGNYQARGNVTKTAEFNFHFDPEAAYIVTRSLQCPITLTGWEPCLDHSLCWDRYDAIYSRSGRAREFISRREARAIEWWRSEGMQFVFADQITMAIALDRSVVESSFRANCTVELHGGMTRGQMIAHKSDKGNIEVVTELNVDKVVNILDEAMSSFD